MSSAIGKIAVLWRGDREARRNATPQNNRFHRVFEELAAAGIDAEPAVYDEAFGDEVRDQLLRAHGVLVWVDPIHQGKTRTALDPLLREVASQGRGSARIPTSSSRWASRRCLPDEASRLGHGHAPLPDRGGVPRAVSVRLRQADRAFSSRTAATAARACGRSKRYRHPWRCDACARSSRPARQRRRAN